MVAKASTKRTNKRVSKLRINLSAIVYREGKFWIAHCLELDIVAEGASPDDAMAALISLCDLQIRVALEESDLESIFRPAPPEIWKLFASGNPLRLPSRKRARNGQPFNSPVDRFEARELALT